MLIGHGTRDELGTSQFFELGRLLAKRLDPLPVEVALLEFQKPTIQAAWRSLVQAGIDRIHVAPLLLFAAGHAKQDIPEIIASCQANDSHVTTDQTRPLSRHPSIIQLVTERTREVVEPLATPVGRRALVMVGRGNRDPCAQADMRVLTEVAARRADVSAAFTAFYAMAAPSLPEVLDSVAQSNAYDDVIVQPHLLFEGRLHRAIVDQVQQAAEQNANVRFLMANYLGPSAEVAEAIAQRVRDRFDTRATSS